MTVRVQRVRNVRFRRLLAVVALASGMAACMTPTQPDDPNELPICPGDPRCD